MKVELHFPFKPISYNAYYRNSRTGKRIKTGSGLAFDEEIAFKLEDYSVELVKFGENLDPSKYIVKLTMRVVNPEFFLKDRSRISKVAGDVDNYVKVVQDHIFKVVEVDDYIVRHVVASDIYGPEASSHVTLERLPIPQEFDH